MKLKLPLSIGIILSLNSNAQQQETKTIITAEITNFRGTLPISNKQYWQGDDSIVIAGSTGPSHVMGAKYLEVNDYNVADSLNPNGDSARTRYIKRYVAKVSTTNYTWTFNITKPSLITNDPILGRNFLVRPGDSIYIRFVDNNRHFLGKGSLRYSLIQEVFKIIESKGPIIFFDKSRKISRYITVTEYLKISQFYDQQINKILGLLKKYKSKLLKEDYEWIKASGLSQLEQKRLTAFNFIPLTEHERRIKGFTYKENDLVRAWDNTMYNPISKWVRSSDVQNIGSIGSRSFIYGFIKNEVKRKFNFSSSDSILNEQTRKKLIYYKIKSDHSGLFRERLLCFFIREQIIQEMGSYSWFAQSILQDYYNIPGFLAYKNWIKKWEKDHQYLSIGVDHGGAPLFILEDLDETKYSYKDITGKFTIFNFWYSGCEPCKEAAIVMADLQNRYRNDTNIVFLNVSVDMDRNKWINSIQEGVFVPKGGKQLITSISGKKHEIIKDFFITEFPTLRLIDHTGKIVIDKYRPTSTMLSVRDLSNIIDQELTKAKDGPYVFYTDGNNIAYSILGKSVIKQTNVKQIISSTDQLDKNLIITLKEKIDIPPSEYKTPKKMIVLSDIEGNFSAFRKLLQANSVIDTNFNWTFGDGHLVFAGDMFDRGEQVTECLWLTYLLEEKAIKAGGLVHFILGNHEIMNLNGNTSYAKEKYNLTSKLLGKTLQEIYNEQSELGKWLRSKNIVEKIGNCLFTHGGISPQINNMPLTIAQINNMARPYYDKSNIATSSSDSNLNILFNTRKSPFWYRHYYQKDYFSKSNNELIRQATENQLDSTCLKFGIDHVITGHTIIADSITVHFGGKVINTDTHHATGKSEALLIEDNNYYRVSQTGSKVLLFKEKASLNGESARN